MQIHIAWYFCFLPVKQAMLVLNNFDFMRKKHWHDIYIEIIKMYIRRDLELL